MTIRSLFAIALIVVVFAFPTFAQTSTIAQTDPQTLGSIAADLRSVSKSLETFNLRLDTFLGSLNKYKGVQLSEKQQKLLFGYEVLNQTEELAGTLRKSLADTVEREVIVRKRLGEIQLAQQPENIDRAFQTLGTTKTDELREGRRRALEEERSILTTLLNDLSASRGRLSEKLRQAETFAESFRQSLFNELGAEIRRP